MISKSYKKIISFILIFTILLGLFPNLFLPTEITYAAEQPNMSNLVIFINFSDTALIEGTSDHYHSGTSLGTCFQDADYTFELFDGEDENGNITNRRAMKQYLDTISYGELRLENIFPQYDSNTNKIIPLTLANTAATYVGQDDMMIEEIISILNRDYARKFPNTTYDHDYAEVLDNLMIVVACDNDRQNNLFSGHESTYAGTKKLSINSKNYSIGHYTLVTEGGAYFGISGSGLLIHEFMHTLGYPDLYHRPSGSEVTRIPVGPWDIMSQENYRVQYPLAYMRQLYSGWLDLPTITTNQTSYTLTAASATNASNKNTQAVILKTPYSDDEIFVIEYRKKGSTVTENPNSQDFDSNIPGSGIIIYRVDTSLNTNIQGAPFMVYVFRPGDTYDSNHHEMADSENAYLMNSYLSAESGRTSYGSNDPAKTLIDNAITYADGTNSGIVISNVGSAAGDTITFDITFNTAEGQHWNTITNGHSNENTTQLSSYMDDDGTLYCIKHEGTGYSNIGLYQYKNNTWTRLGNVPANYTSPKIVKYNGALYLAYIGTDSYAYFAKWDNSSWTTLHKDTSIYASEIDMTTDGSAIYFTYSNQDCSTLYAYKYTSSGITSLATNVGTGLSYAANTNIVASNGIVCILYREFLNNNKLVVKKYDTNSNSWNSLGNLSLTASYATLYSTDNKLYLTASSVNETTSCNVYTYDLSTNSDWTSLGNSFATDSSEMDICLCNEIPYLAYVNSANGKTLVKGLIDNTWTQIGSVLTGDTITGLDIKNIDNTLFVSYLSAISNKTYLRYFTIQNANEPEAPIEPEEPAVPDEPNEPVNPNVPDEPEEPDVPVNPDNPSIPDEPIEPDIPDVPDEPVEPDEPNIPDEPSEPDIPDVPDEPVDPDEPVKNGWVKINGAWYYYKDGIAQTGWLKDAGTWYYLDATGKMTTNWINDGGTWYYLHENGAMATGWINDAGTWYYLHNSGAMATGWVKDGGTWYYLHSSGAMATGWIKDGGTWYYLHSSGAMATGWVLYNGDWYYMDGSGAMAIGWIQYNGDWYYLYSSGAMAYNTWIGNYYVNKNGIWIP